jgi:hypothetical protein
MQNISTSFAPDIQTKGVGEEGGKTTKLEMVAEESSSSSNEESNNI